MRYRAYGVTIDSELELPELEPSDGTTTDVFTFAVDHGAPPSARAAIVYGDTTGKDDALACARCAGGYLQTFVSKWRFFISTNGTRIVAHAPLPAPETLRHLLLDSVLPHALNLSGRDSLHATAVLTPLGVVAFMGPSGAGKSTLAARCILRGLRLVSDDCLILTLQGAGVVAVPSYAGLRLLPDGVAWMGLDVRATAPVAEYGTKRRIADAQTAARTGGRLAAIYVLPSRMAGPRGTHVSIEAVAKRAAFSQLLQGSFRVDIDDRAMVRRQFELFTAIVERVPVSRLQMPWALAAVDEACAAVRADLGF